MPSAVISIIVLNWVISLFFMLYPGEILASDHAGQKTIPAFSAADRVLVLAPHPDDEAIACAGIIQEALRKGARLKVAYLTNGDHNQLAFTVYKKRPLFRADEFIGMGKVRRQEAVKAMRFLGLKEKNLIFLGYPDFGTFSMFSRHWDSRKPFKSILTRISSVPYKDNFSYKATYVAENVLFDLKKILSDYRPNKIFVSHPGDVNVDHKAFYLFLSVALSDLEKQIGRPQVYPYLVHCPGWPLPRRYHPELPLVPPQSFSGSPIDWRVYDLNKEKVERKYRAILENRSQTQSSAFYLLAFARSNELFGDYAELDLSAKEEGGFISFDGRDSSNQEVNGGINSAGEVSCGVANGVFYIKAGKDKELARRFALSAYIFGYKKGVLFAKMPKIMLINRYNVLRMFDKQKKLSPAGVSVKLDKSEVLVGIPLSMLGDPDSMLISVRTYDGMQPRGAAGFRKVNLARN